MVEGDRELKWLRRVRDLCGVIAEETDTDRLLPLIVDSALELANAERGFIVLLEGAAATPRYKVRAARGFAPTELEGADGKFSRSIVRTVVDQGREVLTTRAEDALLLGATSLERERVRSVVGVPLRRQGRVRGALYLDSVADRAFVEQDVPILRTFADQAALALDAAAGQTQPWPRKRRREAPRRGLIGRSPPITRLTAQLHRVARSREVALIVGETGSGKEVVARELHALGADPEEPFIAESCATLSSELLDSELFGHAKGAFTGATSDREGIFVSAGSGTVLLDGVEDMDARLQAKLLRVLQERSVRPLGGHTTREIHCRILAATTADLRALVAKGRFREDLYYRLDVLRIAVPPLRAHREDIPLLVAELAARKGARLDVSPHALNVLASWHWPGNVRELENEVSRILALSVTRVSSNHISETIRSGRGVAPASDGAAPPVTLKGAERSMLEAALRTAGGNKAWAARQLGIPRSNFCRLLKRHGLE